MSIASNAALTAARIMGRYPLFALVPLALRSEWIQAGQHVMYSLGETFFQEASAGAWAYLILNGRVRVLRRAEGKESTQSVLGSGQMFGEYALVKPGLNTASCRAGGDVEVVQIPLTPIRRWLEETAGVRSFLKNWLQLHQLVSHLRGQAYQGFMSARSALAMEPHLIPLEVRAVRTLQTAGLGDDWWIFIQQGEVMLDDGSGAPRQLGPGDCLGEQALLGAGDLPEAVTLSQARCLRLPRAYFIRPDQPALKASAQSYLPQSLQQPTRVRWIGQHEPTDCGLACLAMIAHYHEIAADLERIRASVRTGPRGVSGLDLLQTAQEFALHGHAIRVSVDQLPHVQVPAIMHMNHGHYVVLFRLTAEGAYLGDPASGLVTVSFAYLAERSTGTVLLFRPRLSRSPSI